MLIMGNNYDMCKLYESSSHTLLATKISNIWCERVILCVLNFFFSHFFHFTFSVKDPSHLAIGSCIVIGYAVLPLLSLSIAISYLSWLLYTTVCPILTSVIPSFAPLFVSKNMIVQCENFKE